MERHLRLERFGQGSFLPRDYFHRNLLCCVIDCQISFYCLIWEAAFLKGASNLGKFVLGLLTLGEFGSGCAVPCDLSKRSKCVETILHVEKLSLCHVLYD